jgi:hypothetical protein
MCAESGVRYKVLDKIDDDDDDDDNNNKNNRRVKAKLSLCLTN